MSIHNSLKLSCRFCSSVFNNDRQKRRHESKEHNEEYTQSKQGVRANEKLKNGFFRCLFCSVQIKDNEESRTSHSNSYFHISRRAQYRAFNEEEEVEEEVRGGERSKAANKQDAPLRDIYLHPLNSERNDRIEDDDSFGVNDERESLFPSSENIQR